MHAFAKFTHTHQISMQAFCSTAKRWMLMHPDNIIAVHCKGGKGRTGMMISAFLAFEKQAVDIETKKLLTISGAAEALAVFDRRRTLDPAGSVAVFCSVLQCVAEELQKRWQFLIAAALQILRVGWSVGGFRLFFRTHLKHKQVHLDVVGLFLQGSFAKQFRSG